MRTRPRSIFNLLPLLALVASLLGGALAVTPAHASGPITVNSALDVVANDGHCALREAITAANTNTSSGAAAGECPAGDPSGSDLIQFDAAYTITLDAGLGTLQPSTNLQISGKGVSSTIIQASTCDPTPAVPGCTIATYPVFSVTGGTVFLDQLTVRYGATAGKGGGVSNNGGIVNLDNSLVSRNQASLGGGGIFNQSGTVNVSVSTVDTNVTTGSGGGMYNQATMSISGSTFNNNQAAGDGGAIINTRTGSIWNSTFGYNSAFEVAAIYNNTTTSALAVYNSTFSNNTDGVANFGGIYNQGSLDLRNTMLANNSGFDCYNAYTMSGDVNNLIESNPGGGADCGVPSVTSDPGTLTWGLNGGTTNTFAIDSGSSAIDAGDDATCAAAPVNNLDQRGVTRPQGPHCDIGAYETQADHVNVYASGSLEGAHLIPHTWAQEHNYAGVNSGPAQATNTDGGNVVSSIRVLFGGTSYSEMMGYPNNTTTDFWFPWYNNVAFNSQFRVSNLGGGSTTITVSLAGTPIDSFTLPAGAAIRKNYAGQNAGPMHVSSSGQPILSTIRVLFGGSSYSEMMGFPNNTTTDFWFPWYNNVAMDSQFRVSNLGGTPTTITVSLAGSPIDSFTLPAGAAIRKNYAGQNNGPMQVSSSATPVLATIRVLYGGGSYSEMMGFQNNTTTDFWFPWYDNVGADSQFRVSNLGGSSTTITVSLAGNTIDSFTLGAGAAIRKNYASQNNGAFHITSSGGEPILATVRVLYAGTSFYEVMGYPGNALTSTQYFPWYNDTAFDSQMRIAVP